MLLKYVNKLKEIDQIKEEERAMVRVGEDIYGAVVPSDGGKTGAGSCVYILTEKLEKEQSSGNVAHYSWNETIPLDILLSENKLPSLKRG